MTILYSWLELREDWGLRYARMGSVCRRKGLGDACWSTAAVIGQGDGKGWLER